VIRASFPKSIEYALALLGLHEADSPDLDYDT